MTVGNRTEAGRQTSYSNSWTFNMKIKIFLEEGWEIKLLGEKNEIQLKMKKMYFAAWVEQKVELKLLLPVTPEARQGGQSDSHDSRDAQTSWHVSSLVSRNVCVGAITPENDLGLDQKWRGVLFFFTPATLHISLYIYRYICVFEGTKWREITRVLTALYCVMILLLFAAPSEQQQSFLKRELVLAENRILNGLLNRGSSMTAGLRARREAVK